MFGAPVIDGTPVAVWAVASEPGEAPVAYICETQEQAERLAAAIRERGDAHPVVRAVSLTLRSR